MAIVGFVLLLLIVPTPELPQGFSSVVIAEDQSLLGARIADDGQWRFPVPDSIPSNFEQCILHFEDEYFYNHPGINPISIFRAIRQNLKAGKVVSGGSTITMQLARILRGNRKRSIWNKLVEALVAVQLELKYSKSTILNQYSGLAPFGGNVVGIETAAWRYYGRSAHQLSWSEAATLAVLPNAPSLIYPGKGQKLLMIKRNRLLTKLNERGLISETDTELAKAEPLPQKPYPLPNLAPHLIQRSANDGYLGKQLHSTINYHLQKQHLEIAQRYHNLYHYNEVHNLAIITVDIATGAIKSYVGNSACENKSEGIDVDIITAPRSSGSILKPLLFASAYDQGVISPSSLLADIPIKIAGYTPKNFDMTYSGAITSGDALTKSLNIPAVRLLQDQGVELFLDLLKDLDFTTIDKTSDHYGLSLILGGAEVTLYDLVKVYRGLSMDLIDYQNPTNRAPLHYSLTDVTKSESSGDEIGAGAIFTTIEVLSNLKRPRIEDGWQSFSSGRKIAWKTGTSFGHRDAWAIGMDGTHVVGVWVGNADGEGRPGLTGLNYAGPLLFDVFGTLPMGKWYPTPYDDIENIALCGHSGYRIGRNCTDTIYSTLPLNMTKLDVCDFHELIYTTSDASHRVNLACHSAKNAVQQSYFQLPAVQSYYYRKKNINYRSLPPWKEGCNQSKEKNIDIIYPFPNADVSIPIDFGGARQKVVFSAVHADTDAELYWYINGRFIKKTRDRHEILVDESSGDHTLHLVDHNGNEKWRKFKIVE